MVRLCVLNLVVAGASEAHADEAAEVVTEIAAHHPARAILLIADPTAGAGIAADLSLQCVIAAGAGQACVETVRLRIGGDAALHLRSVVPPLLLPDVPTHLWLHGPAPLDQALDADTLELCERVVVDSEAYDDARATLRRLAVTPPRSDGSLPLSDLAWIRTRPWREQLARAFDPPTHRALLGGVARIDLVTDDGARTPPGALLLAGWLLSRLRRDGSGTAPQVDIAPGGPGSRGRTGALRRLTLHCSSAGGQGTVSIERQGEALRTSVEIDGGAEPVRAVPVEEPRLADLVGAALQETRGDAVFSDALRAAAALP